MLASQMLVFKFLIQSIKNCLFNKHKIEYISGIKKKKKREVFSQEILRRNILSLRIKVSRSYNFLFILIKNKEEKETMLILIHVS